MPLLLGHLARGALILLDDADRSEEQTIVRRWEQHYPVRQVRSYPTERGAVVLEYLG
ncbi:MAG: hypothetical protein HC915_08330 [Anaerolineae bacterium]|nr:hypothetical protein [Anaerolineae bacterium]